MSKPVVRVVLAVLVSLAIIAAIAPSVQARLGSVMTQAGGSATKEVTGRTSASARPASIYQFEYIDPSPSGGGCERSDSSTDD